MREPCCLWLSAADRARLAAIAADRNSPQKHVWRVNIVLLSADRLGTVEIMRRTGKAKPSVWRWQARYLEAGVDGLVRDRTRPARIPRLAAGLVERVVARTLAPPPGEATHWTVRAMARDIGISPASVQRIWAAHGLQPHRVRTFKLSRDPAFATKLRDVVGLYVDPPAHSLVLSVDEKSQIQALDPTQPGLPMKKGRAGTMTHDDKRNGTTTLFAALNLLDGSVIGQCMQRHRHREFIRFLNRIERDVPAGKLIHVVLDNYATHKHPKVRAWLKRHDRWTFHFTPTSASWLNAVEGFFAQLTWRRLQRGVFHSLVDLQAAINRYLAEHNQAPRPFVWTAEPEAILAKVKRGHQTLETIHYRRRHGLRALPLPRPGRRQRLLDRLADQPLIGDAARRRPALERLQHWSRQAHGQARVLVLILQLARPELAEIQVREILVEERLGLLIGPEPGHPSHRRRSPGCACSVR